MIFVSSVEKNRALVIYLQTLLPDKLKNKGRNIIKSFLSILEATIKTDWLKNFFIGNTRIIICMDATGMEVDISDIKRVIQWKIINHSIFVTIFWQVKREAQRIEI